MFTTERAYSSFAVPDIDAAVAFYRDTLGLDVTVWEEMGGGFTFKLPAGGSVFVYPKEDHQPATFTVLNIMVDDVEAAVDDLGAKGVSFEQYDEEPIRTDEKGIARSFGGGMAWFKDPAGNIVSLIEGPSAG